MYKIGNYVIQQTLVVGDNHRGIFRDPKFLMIIHTIGHHFKCIDVEALSQFHQGWPAWVQASPSEKFHSFFSHHPENPSFTERLVKLYHECRRAFFFSMHGSRNSPGRHGIKPFVFPVFVECRTHEVVHAYTGYFNRVLKSQENSFERTFFW